LIVLLLHTAPSPPRSSFSATPAPLPTASSPEWPVRRFREGYGENTRKNPLFLKIFQAQMLQRLLSQLHVIGISNLFDGQIASLEALKCTGNHHHLMPIDRGLVFESKLMILNAEFEQVHNDWEGQCRLRHKWAFSISITRRHPVVTLGRGRQGRGDVGHGRLPSGWRDEGGHGLLVNHDPQRLSPAGRSHLPQQRARTPGVSSPAHRRSTYARQPCSGSCGNAWPLLQVYAAAKTTASAVTEKRTRTTRLLDAMTGGQC
ncbi:hypothetical protein EJB05_13454, partial [Eragrostis curvula]